MHRGRTDCAGSATLRSPARGGWRLGNAHLDAQAWVCVAQYHVAAVSLCDGRNQTETETVARCGAAGVQPIERTEHPLTFRACYTGPVVLHPKCQHLTRYRRAEISFRPGRRVQACVLDEIAEHLNQQFAIAVEGKVAAMG